MYFKITLAGVTIGIQSIYDEVFSLCRDYLTEDAEEFLVVTGEEDIRFEQDRSVREAITERRPVYDFPDPYLETLAVYRKITAAMLSRNVLLMHGSAVAVGDKAYLFTAPSGTGKTTHSSFWVQNIPGAFILNGDKPLIRVGDNGSSICGTPWAGKEGTNVNTTVPLTAVCILRRGETNCIRPTTFREIYPLLYEQTYRFSDRQDVVKTMQLLKKLSETVRFYKLSCNLDPHAANVAYEGMQG